MRREFSSQDKSNRVKNCKSPNAKITSAPTGNQSIMNHIQPTTVEAIAATIQAAISKRAQIVISDQVESPGQRTTVCLNHLNKIIDYPFDDMTITVQAGMTYAELAGHLTEHNQQLPIDVVNPDTTIGQLVAENCFGPRIAGYGTVRDYLIGSQGVDGTGRIFRSGGRVVKNVAGYDLCRLMIGSKGRLAVITECTFKLKPKPEGTAAVRLQFDSISQLDFSLKALNKTKARPMIADIQARPATEHESILIVAVEGSAASCDWQLKQIESECNAKSATRLTESEVNDHCSAPENFRQNHDLRVKTLRSVVAAVTDQLLHLNSHVSGHAADGILNCCDSEGLRNSLRSKFSQEQLLFVDATPAFSQQDHPMNEAIVKAFDPHSVFAHTAG